MNIVLISDHTLVENSGPGLRLSQTVAALGRIGLVHTIFLRHEGWSQVGPKSNNTTITVGWDDGKGGWLRWLFSRSPFYSRYKNTEQLGNRLSPILETADLIWVHRARPYKVVRNMPLTSPIIVDLDDLNDLLYGELIKEAIKVDGKAVLKSYMNRLMLHIDIGRWKRYQQMIAQEVKYVIVTNKEDMQHLGAETATVVENSYPKVKTVSSRSNKPCRLIFVGGFHYLPNATAAKVLALEVLPHVRNRLPNAELMLIGKSGPVIPELQIQEGVTYYGEVNTLDEYYEEATAAVTLLRSGAGTCLKVIEAIARKIPLVSTRFGARGFDLIDGEHYLLAESASEAVNAVVELQNNPALAKRLVENAYQHYIVRFERSIIESKIQTIAENTLVM